MRRSASSGSPQKTGTPSQEPDADVGAERGNPRASNLLTVISALQQASGLHLEVAAVR